jgi:hypothetical protein
MDKLEFNFEDRFNVCFYSDWFLTSGKGIGKSLKKALSLKVSTRFSDHFTVLRPEHITYERLLENVNQLIVIELINDGGVALGDSLNYLTETCFFCGRLGLFLWRQVSRNLTMHDFALNDPLLIYFMC